MTYNVSSGTLNSTIPIPIPSYHNFMENNMIMYDYDIAQPSPVQYWKKNI